jgi:hypothetical protein
MDMKMRTALDAGGLSASDYETSRMRTALKAGGVPGNRNEELHVGTSLTAGGYGSNHNQMIRQKPDRRVVSMLGPLCPRRRKDDRLDLAAVPAGVRAGLLRR